MRTWDLGPGRFMAAGGFSDLAVHHHPAVQVTVGGQGPLTLSRGGDAHEARRLVVVGSGTRHAVRSDARSAALTLYFGLQTPQGIALNRLTRNRGQHEGIWIVDDGPFTRSYDRRLKSCRAECPATSMWLRSRMPWRYRRITSGGCAPQLRRPRRSVRRIRQRGRRGTTTRPQGRRSGEPVNLSGLAISHRAQTFPSCTVIAIIRGSISRYPSLPGQPGV